MFFDLAIKATPLQITAAFSKNMPWGSSSSGGSSITSNPISLKMLTYASCCFLAISKSMSPTFCSEEETLKKNKKTSGR